MLVDGAIRSRVVVLGEVVNDDVETALEDVMRGASTRRRRVLMTRIAVVAALAVATAGIWFGSVGSYIERDVRPEPAQRTDRSDELDRQRSERGEMLDDLRESGEVPGESWLRGPASNRRHDGASAGSPRFHPSGSADPAPKTNGAGGGDPLRSSEDGGVLRRETVEYQMPVVKQPRVDSRQNCSWFGEGCVDFETRPEDRFFTVSVHDDSESDVLVRITQWNRHGGTIGAPTIYCGGVSEKLEIRPGSERVLVEIDNGNCPDGRETRPRGGLVEFVLFDG